MSHSITSTIYMTTLKSGYRIVQLGPKLIRAEINEPKQLQSEYFAFVIGELFQGEQTGRYQSAVVIRQDL